MKKLLLITFFVIFSFLTFAQNSFHRWAVGVHMNTTAYQGDLGNGFLDFGNFKPGVTFSASCYLTPVLDVFAKVAYAQSQYIDEDGTYKKGGGGYADGVGTQFGSWAFKNQMWMSSLNAKAKFNNDWILPEDSFIQPYLILGIGFTRSESETYRNTKSNKVYTNFTYSYGLGTDFRLSNVWELVIEAGIHNPTTDVYDGIDKTTAKGWAGVSDSRDEFLQYSIGIRYILGGDKYEGRGEFCD